MVGFEDFHIRSVGSIQLAGTSVYLEDMVVPVTFLLEEPASTMGHWLRTESERFQNIFYHILSEQQRLYEQADAKGLLDSAKSEIKRMEVVPKKVVRQGKQLVADTLPELTPQECFMYLSLDHSLIYAEMVWSCVYGAGTTPYLYTVFNKDLALVHMYVGLSQEFIEDLHAVMEYYSGRRNETETKRLYFCMYDIFKLLSPEQLPLPYDEFFLFCQQVLKEQQLGGDRNLLEKIKSRFETRLEERKADLLPAPRAVYYAFLIFSQGDHYPLRGEHFFIDFMQEIQCVGLPEERIQAVVFEGFSELLKVR